MTTKAKKTEETAELQKFSYPTVGAGIVIYAVDQQEADAKAQEILASLQ